ncbi:MAG: multidrug resistance efflux transporter family protein [Rhodanobacter denitrificans]|uniref:Multidrug resistance efflux transporter family protein n=1 Tax=Rhodanobacter denitrificans TaxID=666685 RepID=A0A2W5KN42_9GAMM|nr:MAG: multidrug resistance efflux transporter family protein [Rhodanobacter denitrificans]
MGVALVSALFFTLTYVLNRLAATSGGHWAWTAALRYLITLPLLAAVLPFAGGLGELRAVIGRHPGIWLLWSLIGFGLFCACLTYAAASGPSWLVAGSFQITVIAGLLMSPLIYEDARRRIPLPALAAGLVVVAGVLLMQLDHADGRLDRAGWIALACVVVAAFAYPLGNRMLLLHLERTGQHLTTLQRVFGMTLMSQPAWLVLAGWGWLQAGPPSWVQTLSAAGVALASGVVATLLFFAATEWVREDPTALAAVEAMQAAELLFATALGVLLLGEAWPLGRALGGACLIVAGIVAFCLISGRRAAPA